MAWVPGANPQNPGLPSLPWYESLEGPRVEGPDQEEGAVSPPQTTARIPSLVELCGEAVRCAVMEAAWKCNYWPAVQVLCLPCQLPNLELATEAAFQAVVWADRTIPEEAWDMLPPEIQEVIQLIRSLRRAEGIPAFVGGAGVSKVGARELLACAQEGLGERHERLCKAMSDVAARLVLSCIRPSGGLQDVGDSVIWGCAHGAAVQLVIDALQEPSWRSSQHSLKAKFDYLVHRIFSADAVRQEELEIAQRHLDYLMPLEQKIRKAMAIVRTLWMVQGGREGSGSGGSEATSDPLQDVAFLSGLHGKGWRARHSASYVESFHASRQDVLAVILDALSGKVI